MVQPRRIFLFVSREPRDEFEARVSGTAARHDEYHATLSSVRLSSPLEDRVRNRAVFGLVEMDVSERLSAAFEVRYAEEDKARIDPLFEGARTFYSFTPRATLSWDFSDEVRLYGIIASGNKPGGINGFQGAPFGFATCEEEVSSNFELGAKTVRWGGRMTANVAAYYIDAQDVQRTTAVGAVIGSTTSIATNQGSADIWGAELEMAAAITDNLVIGASYAYTRPRVTEGCDDFEYVLNSGGLLIPPLDQLTPQDRELCSIRGQQLPLTSEHQASVNARFSQQLGWQNLEMVHLHRCDLRVEQVHAGAQPRQDRCCDPGGAAAWRGERAAARGPVRPQHLR